MHFCAASISIEGILPANRSEIVSRCALGTWILFSRAGSAEPRPLAGARPNKGLLGVIGANDVELAHLILKGCPFESEPFGCSPMSADPAGRVLERIDDYLPLRLLERRSGCNYRLVRRSLHFGAWDIQLISLRQNHTSLNEVLQFANISRPIGVHQHLHR